MQIRRTKAWVVGLAALATCVGFPVQATETPVELLVSGTAHQALFAMDFDGDRGIAVGAGGEIQTTTDGGKSWIASSVPTELTLLGVHADSTRTIAVGQTGIAFLQSAGGQWEKIDTGMTKRLFGVSSNEGGLAVAVGEFGAILLSRDGGRTWHILTIDWAKFETEGGAEPHLYGVDVSVEGAISVVGEFGLVIRSIDGGRSWSRQNKGTASLFAIEIRGDGVGFAVGQDGYALKSIDHGVTWSCIDLGSKAILNGVSSSADGKVAVSGMREMIVSSDDGTNWQKVKSAEIATIWYVGVASRDSGVLAAGQAGRIVRVGG
ncbi:MAG: WD40/YVTN/BNR-like repeat-containing protein [Panacagrimonas sp.]